MTEDLEARLRRTLNARAGRVEFDAARWTATITGAAAGAAASGAATETAAALTGTTAPGLSLIHI